MTDETGTADASGLAQLRIEIERIDRDLIERIVERTRLAQRVGVIKRAAGLPILDPGREAVVARRAGELARETGLKEDHVRNLFWHLIALCRDAQLEENRDVG